MGRGIEIPINPDILHWAIRESGHRVDEVARYLGISESELRQWGRSKRPKLTQFRQLASFLDRPTAAFFLPRPPDRTTPQIAFRHLPGSESRDPSPRERRRVREAHRLQRGVAWMLEELGEERIPLPRIDPARDPESHAVSVRKHLGVGYDTQLSWKDEWEALRAWRSVLEEQGILVLLLPIGGESARGFSLYDPSAPLIAANTHWRATARIFTLFHEYGHLATRTNSICADVSRGGRRGGGDRIERWCEEFAASFLAPWELVSSLLADRFGWSSDDRITDLGRASWLANKLHISLRASVLRLISRGVADWSLYSAIPPLADRKPGGGGSGGRRRSEISIGEYGKLPARVILRALDRQFISRADALTYLDVPDSDLSAIGSLARS